MMNMNSCDWSQSKKTSLQYAGRRILLAVMLVAGTSAWAEDPIIIKFSHVVTADTPKGKAAERFKQLAEVATGGRVKVQVYPNSQLYKDKEELEALQIGAVQMLAPSLSKFGPLGAKQFEMFDLPYLFPNEEAFHRVTESEVGQDLLKSLEKQRIKGLAYWSGGFHVFSANQPLLKSGDLKGLKMRIPSSKVIEASSRTLGALPQVMAFSEVYQALQSGVVDGTENVLSSYTSQKYFEVQKYATLTYHTHTGYAVVVNKKFWDNLPVDIQTALTRAMKAASDYEVRLMVQENAAALVALKASGKIQIQDLTPAQRAEWQTALLPVYGEIELRIGTDVIQKAKKLAGSGIN